jgi:multimeric flavodoxin WrbA
MKCLLISGSPRKGNTEFILKRIFEGLDSGDKELILLREARIAHCQGCLYCDKNDSCCINDDMQEIYGRLEEADIIILGTPNYYDSVPGLLKDFMDRTNPFYETDLIKGKKIINIIVGGGNLKNSKRVFDGSLKFFEEAHGLKVLDSYFFQALHVGEVESDDDSESYIDVIIDKINGLNV